jgi:hypothetical protein
MIWMPERIMKLVTKIRMAPIIGTGNHREQAADLWREAERDEQSAGGEAD